MAAWNAKKRVIPREEMPEHHRLKPTLSWPHLIALGVGAIVGTGILTLTGVGAAKAGPRCWASAGTAPASVSVGNSIRMAWRISILPLIEISLQQAKVRVNPG